MRADRLLALMMLLQARQKMTARELAEELEVSRRTILRDIDALSVAGIPIYAEGGHGGGVYLDKKYQIALRGLKDAEVHALFISGSSSVLADIGMSETAENTLLKLFAALPSLQQKAVEYIRQRVHIDPVWWWHEVYPQSLWSDVQKAVYEDICIRVVYEHHDGEIVQRTLEPYSLVIKAGIWYLVARRDEQFRTYRLSRFHAVELSDKRFERESGFDLAAYWSAHTTANATYANYTCTVNVTQNGAAFLARHSHEIRTLAEEGERLTVQIKVETQETARMLVFELGAQAIVLEPDALRASVEAGAREILAHNNGKSHLP